MRAWHARPLTFSQSRRTTVRHMTSLKTIARTFIADESGATALEYCFIAVLVSIAAITAWSQIGTGLNVRQQPVVSALN
jgi:pilus assembly protein Flp/PilA